MCVGIDLVLGAKPGNYWEIVAHLDRNAKIMTQNLNVDKTISVSFGLAMEEYPELFGILLFDLFTLVWKQGFL